MLLENLVNSLVDVLNFVPVPGQFSY